MNNLKLTVDLLPKGAWGNNLRTALSKDQWDTLRQKCYRRFNYACSVCGYKSENLDAHEVWEFDIAEKTQTLRDIIALCPACHGVKHLRNSQRIGYGENAKRHFLKINNCDELTFAKHFLQAQLLFEERNQVLRWKLKADLGKFGNEKMEVFPRRIPVISNPYENVDWNTAGYSVSENEISSPQNLATSTDRYPKIRSVEVDNYQGNIIIVADFTDKIDWVADQKILKTKYSSAGRLSAKFNVENLEVHSVQFVLTNNTSTRTSQKFDLTNPLQ